MPQIIDSAALGAPRLKEALLYWQRKRGSRAMPSRRDLDPIEMPKLLPFVMLYDVLASPLDFRYRLIGTEVRSILAADYTGKRFSEVPGKGRGSVVWDNCEQVVLSKMPFSRSPPYVGPERVLRACENLLLPLSDDGVAVNMILQAISFERGIA
ncbi:MAG TPA: PAS domain-containing protein [Stellaceae bacterium]|nr:PAS domain-containing protein [Stellaceae bacterium]